LKILNRLNWFNLKQFIGVTFGNLLLQGVTLFSEFYILNLISIEEVGQWQFCMLLQGYAVLSKLGIINSFNREYVFHNQIGNTLHANDIYGTTVAHTKLSSLLQAVFFAVLAFYYLNQTQSLLLVFSFVTMIIFTVFEGFINLQEAFLRSHFLYRELSISRICFAGLVLVSLVIPYFFGYRGFLIRVVLIQVGSFIILYLLSAKWKEAKLTSSLKSWKMLFKDGWKYWLLAYLKNANKSMPKLFILFYVGILGLGLFTPVNWVILAFSALIGNLNSFIYPILIKRFAQVEKTLFKDTILINFYAFLFVLPIVVFFYYFTPEIFLTYLPQYKGSINAIRIVLFASLLDIFSSNSTIWYVTRQWRNLFVYHVLLLCFSATIYFYLMKPGLLLMDFSLAHQ
jgi:O-antigen/teichoic acid export membrane protein